VGIFLGHFPKHACTVSIVQYCPFHPDLPHHTFIASMTNFFRYSRPAFTINYQYLNGKKSVDSSTQQETDQHVGQEVVSDGFNGHSQSDVEGSTYVTSVKTTLPPTHGWTVVNRRLRNERKAHSFDLIPSY
jgi:hypothetical protein